MQKQTIVLGLGNPLMADEGIGVYIINEFLKQKDKFPLVDFIDAGTAGLSVMHMLAGRKKAVFIDCAYMETQPGTIKRFTPDDVVIFGIEPQDISPDRMLSRPLRDNIDKYITAIASELNV